MHPSFSHGRVVLGSDFHYFLRRLKGAGFAGKRISDGESWKQHPGEIL